MFKNRQYHWHKQGWSQKRSVRQDSVDIYNNKYRLGVNIKLLERVIFQRPKKPIFLRGHQKVDILLNREKKLKQTTVTTTEYAFLPVMCTILHDSLIVLSVLNFFLMAYQLRGLFSAKAILVEEQQLYYLTQSWKDKGFLPFPRNISSKVNAKVRLEFELPYYNVAIQHVSDYTTGTLPPRFWCSIHENEEKALLLEHPVWADALSIDSVRPFVDIRVDG